MNTPKLTPLNREWVSPSLLWREVALCRDQDGALWFCRFAGETEGWTKIQPATASVIAGFRQSQELAGKEPQPWPDPPAPAPL